VLRQGTRRWPPKYETLNNAKTEKRINPKTKRLAQFYLCAACATEHTSTGVAVDHVEPVVGPEGFTTWDNYIERMFCEANNLQVLCDSCHHLKTQEEKQLRANKKSEDFLHPE
jgi:ribosomal protein L44E